MLILNITIYITPFGTYSNLLEIYSNFVCHLPIKVSTMYQSYQQLGNTDETCIFQAGVLSVRGPETHVGPADAGHQFGIQIASYERNS